MNDELQNLIKKQLSQPNFLIQTSESITNSDKYAVIYCSSNGVYQKDTVEEFKDKILKTDNYEWYMNRVPYAEKHIFIRDVSKRFYQFGINDNGLDSIEKVTQMLKKETEGYKVITVGSSSGGMAAIVFGKLLNAEFVLAFSPILRPFKPDEPLDKINSKLQSKEYFDALPSAKSDIPIFFLFPNGSDWDIYNSSLVENYPNIYFVPVISDVHGVPVNKRVLKKLLSSKCSELKTIYKYKSTDAVSEFAFVRINWGFKMYLQRILDYIKKYPLFFLRKDFYTLVIN